MELKNKICLEVIKQDRLYQMILPPDAQLGECYCVLCDMLQDVANRIQDFAQKSQPKKVEEEEKPNGERTDNK